MSFLVEKTPNGKFSNGKSDFSGIGTNDFILRKNELTCTRILVKNYLNSQERSKQCDDEAGANRKKPKITKMGVDLILNEKF